MGVDWLKRRPQGTARLWIGKGKYQTVAASRAQPGDNCRCVRRHMARGQRSSERPLDHHGGILRKAESPAALPEMRPCGSALTPGDRVLVVSPLAAAISHIASPDVLPAALRSRLPTLIADVATTGIRDLTIDPDRRCLLGIISSKDHRA